jgi:hypothetical protein
VFLSEANRPIWRHLSIFYFHLICIQHYALFRFEILEVTKKEATIERYEVSLGLSVQKLHRRNTKHTNTHFYSRPRSQNKKLAPCRTTPPFRQHRFLPNPAGLRPRRLVHRRIHRLAHHHHHHPRRILLRVRNIAATCISTKIGALGLKNYEK